MRWRPSSLSSNYVIKAFPKKLNLEDCFLCFLTETIAKELEISPSKHESSFMEMHRASNFDWNTSPSFLLWSSDEATKVFSQ